MDKVLHFKKIRRAQRNRALREENGKIAEKESTKGASAPLSFPSIPTGGVSYQYDVFLSFRGTDTRKGFIDHLYRKLISEGTVSISVFKDDESLEIGEDINSKILDAITRSKISILVISENYASSKWCLCELVHIMDCKKSMSHMVFPIFYKVEPSDVRHQRGNFGKAFGSCEKRLHKKDIQKVKQALTRVSDLSGWESEKFANGFEGKLVEVVAKTIESKLRNDFLPEIPKHLLGVDDHVNKIRNWVDTHSSHARMIGIHGMGGIGKTTLANVIYNKLSNEFVHHSFLSDIGEKALCSNILTLQKRLIKDISQVEQEVCEVDDGIKLMKSRLRGKKVLILLDDIDNQDQLNALARERDWFSAGSIIIVTTRNETILDRSTFQVDYKYGLKELDYMHSLLLFKRHAFPTGHCSKDFEGISRDIISTMGGLPLAIKVIGSSLYGQTRKKVWEDVLKKLRNERVRDVQKTLKISYDALESMAKEIFLDLAVFYSGGKSRECAGYMWEHHGFYQEIEELKLRCLIKISHDGVFMVHDQLRDLGRSIFCQGQPRRGCLKRWLDQEAFPNETILDRSTFQVDYKYGLKELNYMHSLLLFERHAFPMGHCSKDFEGIYRDIISTTGGLLLAIKVIGSSLYGQTRNEVWEDVLKKSRNKRVGDVQEKLKISYDALGSKNKEIFLNIACFFVGKDRKCAMYKWEGREFYPHQEIEELKLRCLINIGDDDKCRMHDQLRDLGRMILSQGQPRRGCQKLVVDQEAFPKGLGYKDETALVVGNDMGTVGFAKQLGDTDVLQATEVDSSVVELDDDFDELTKGSETSSSTEPFEKKSHKKQRCADNDDKFTTILKQLEQMASVSLGQDNVDYLRLYNEVMKVDGYDEVALGSVFDYLVENEKIGKAFMVKSANLQKVWTDKFLSKGEHNR